MIRSISIFFFARIVSSFVSFVSLSVYIRWLGPAEFAVYALILSFSYILSTFTYRWINASVTRFYSDDQYGERVISISICILIAISIVQIPVAALVAMLGDNFWAEAVMLSTALSIATGLFETSMAILRVSGAATRYALADIGRTLIIFGLGGWLAYNGYGYAGVLWVTIASTFIVSVLAMQGRRVVVWPFLIDWAAVRTFLAFGGPITIVGAFAILYATSGRFIMAERVGLTEAGYFIAAATLCDRTIQMLTTNLNTTIAPAIFQSYHNAELDKTKYMLVNYFNGIVLITAPLTLLFIFSNDSISNIMLGSVAASGAAIYLPYLAIASTFMAITQSYYSYSFSISKNTKKQLYIIIPGTIINGISIFTGIYLFGGIGAAYGAIFGAVLMLLMTIYLGMSQFVMPWPSRGALRAFLASAIGIPFMLWADALSSSTAALAAMIAAAIAIGMAALVLNVPLARMVATKASMAAQRMIGR